MNVIKRSTVARVVRTGLAWLALVGPASTVLAETLFHEDFNVYDTEPGQPCAIGAGGPGTYLFAPGWLLRNVDNRTPDPSVAYVNEAWEVREDFRDDVTNCAAFSTSWYTPAGAANDWMWTPRIDLPAASAIELSWRAKAYDPAYADGYEVRVMVAPTTPTGGTGSIGNQITSSTVVFSTSAEQTQWATHVVPLNAYAGQGIYVGFRNNSNDKFLLVVDDVKVEQLVAFNPALVALGDAIEYTRVPAFLAYPSNIVAQVRNNGVNPLTQVQANGDVLVDGASLVPVASSPVSLAPQASADVPLAAPAYDFIGAWSVSATVTAAEGDDAPADASLTQALLEVTEGELSRWEGARVRTIGIGAGSGGEIGHTFDLPAAAAVEGFHIVIDNVDALEPSDGIGDFNGVAMQATLRAWDQTADLPGDLIYTSTYVVPTDAPLGELDLDFQLPDIALAPGRYLASVVEPIGLTLTLVQTEGRFMPRTLWATWPAQAWTPVETLGTSFSNAAKISMSLHPVRYAVGGTVQGLAGSGLVLQVNGGSDLAIAADGAFAFPPMDDGSSYVVTVLAQPGAPNQTCAVANGTGDITGANVSDVAVTCATHQHTVGGTVSGLVGSGLELQLNGGGDLPIAADGAFAFPPMDDGSAYVVTVLTQPGAPNQTCTVTNGTGDITGANVSDIAVTCATHQHTVGGSVSGLVGSGLELQLNGGGDLAIAADGAFVFSPIADGSPYAVTVSNQPSGPVQTCAVSNGDGTIEGADVTDVAIACDNAFDLIFVDGFDG